MSDPLDALAERIRRAAGAPGVLLAWRHETGDVEVGHAASGEQWSPHGAVRIASATKPYVAACVMRLVEDGELSLDMAVVDAAPGEEVEILRSAGLDPAAITVDDLLRHTAGLGDHASDPAYHAEVVTNPGRVWTRAEQIAWAARQPPPAPPGQRVVYSDSGYVLLGAVVEKTTGLPLASAVRTTVRLDSLGLPATWWEDMEAMPEEATRVPQYFEGLDLANVDASCDLYGGGGMLASAPDLACFMAALRIGGILGEQTLAMMLSETPLSGFPGYGRGMYRLPELGRSWWGHGGFWGVASGADESGRAFAICITERAAALRYLSQAVCDLAMAMGVVAG